MPQLIAMIIVVVGAMIYMFQTFGGTGDKIEGIAQKTSIITEINNIKNGLKLAAKAGDIKTDTTLKTLAGLKYFDEQINEQVDANATANANKYYAISFGGTTDDSTPDMTIQLVHNMTNAIPGVYVEFANGLEGNAGFLEAQIAEDLKSIATIDRAAIAPTALALNATGTSLEKRTPTLGTSSSTLDTNGKFIIYFKDFSSSEVVEAP